MDSGHTHPAPAVFNGSPGESWLATPAAIAAGVVVVDGGVAVVERFDAGLDAGLGHVTAGGGCATAPAAARGAWWAVALGAAAWARRRRRR